MTANVLVRSRPANKYRFFYHYNKAKKCLTVHWRGRCILVDELVCHVPAESKTSDKQPRYVLQGWAEDVELELTSGGKTLAIIV